MGCVCITVISISESSSATAHNNQRKLVRTSDGTLYAIYRRIWPGTKYQVYVKKSVDDGATWTDETLLSTASGMDAENQSSPSIAVDSNDDLHVTFHGKADAPADNNDQVWYAEYTAGGWVTPVRISTGPSQPSFPQRYPCIAVDSDNNPHIVWSGQDTGFGAPQIWYVVRNGGWSAPVLLSSIFEMKNNTQVYASIAIDSDNNLHVVWQGRVTFQAIWYTERNGGWSVPVVISTYPGMDSYVQEYACIAVDKLNNLHVVWKGQATGYTTDKQIWYVERPNGGWVTPVRISTLAEMEDWEQYNPSIAVDSVNHLHVLWRGRTVGVRGIWYNKYETDWGTPSCIQVHAWHRYPNLRWSRHPASNIPVTFMDYVWQSESSSPYNVNFSYEELPLPPSGGAGWPYSDWAGD